MVTVPRPFDPKLFVAAEDNISERGGMEIFVFEAGDERRCCWLLPPGSSPFSYSSRHVLNQWQLEPYAAGTLAVAGSPKKLYAIFTAYLLTGHWPSYEKGYPR